MIETLKQRLFWLVARTCFAAYRVFPIFGRLRASIGIIYRDGKFLMIERNDGRGVSLPGGISSRGEAAEATIHREVHEETGLDVVQATLLFEYFSDNDVPVNTSLFRVTVRGEMKDSWEGRPRWMTVEEMEPRILPSQRRVVDEMRKILAVDQV